jgi:GTP-binding protein
MPFDNSILTIAIVGRPNVGKSTLFNRMVGRRMALVHDEPGVTRDRREAQATFMGLPIRVIDTPGLVDPHTGEQSKTLHAGMYGQTCSAIDQSDVVLFVMDGIEGATAYDRDIVHLLRKSCKPVVVLVNKCEGKRGLQGMSDANTFGFQHILTISAEHGEGMSNLLDVLISFAPHEYEENECAAEKEEEQVFDEGPKKPLRLAIMGRPNVGKSTLVNALLGEERQLTADMPGVTRDAITLPFDYEGRSIQLVDTAGIRRKSQVQNFVERLAVIDAENTLRFAEVVVLVIDASIQVENLIEKQDLTLASQIIEEGRCLVLALNKWDKVTDKAKVLSHIEHQIEHHLAQAKGMACVPISALMGRNTELLMQAVFNGEKAWNTRLPTASMNNWLRFAVEAHPTPTVSGHRIRLKYMTQVKSRPPSFVIFCTKGDDVPDSYKRYLINTLKKDFDLFATPIRLTFRTQKNPYKK